MIIKYAEMIDSKPNKSKSMYSLIKALFHLKKIKKLQKKKPIAPTCMMVDLEAFCNDNCSFCTTRKENGYNNQMLNLLQIDKKGKKSVSVNQFRPIGRPSVKSRLPLHMAYKLPEMIKEAEIPAIELTGGGEPTLWPLFDELVENLAKNDIEIGLVTNGSSISERRAHLIAKHCLWIRFSMDASNKELHRKMHRTPNFDFEKRIENIAKIVRLKYEQLTIGVSFVISPDNQHDIEASCRFYKKSGVDHIRFTWMYDKNGKAGLSDKEISKIKRQLALCETRYDDENFAVLQDPNRIDWYSKPNDDFETCYMQRFVWAVGADSKVYPCCIRKYFPGSEIGDLNTHTLKQIIYNKYADDKMNGLDPNSCPSCWLRIKNQMMEDVIENVTNKKDFDYLLKISDKPLHVNFV